MSPFEKTTVNNCHAKRDTKTCSGVAGLFFSVTFGVSTRLCPLDSPLPIICHCPAHIIIGRAIQLLNRSA
ncbi:hypothetical protein [Candidatus Spongiihabitans sp.]|uniref:hypothetical protein n=1 Tax=Candidatus Spongiihabitans sp. TaxID=3101308 RepID=UPI003C7C234C